MRLSKILKKAPRWILKNRFFLFNRFRFKHVGKHSCIVKPLQVDGMDNIFIGDNVKIDEGGWLAALPLTGDSVQLVFKDGATIGHFNHIFATQSIVIEQDVLTADKVYISDNMHNYGDVYLPIKKQPIKQCRPVVIGEGSWIGENVCIIGATVGKHCVIGANSVVTHDIPDYSVAVGAPARVIKQYDLIKNEWIPVFSN